MMRLIQTDKGWYFCIDVYGVPFSQSKTYKTEQEASLAALNNQIKWDEVDGKKWKEINDIAKFCCGFREEWGK